MGDSTPVAENILGLFDFSGNSHIWTTLGGRMFNMLFTCTTTFLLENYDEIMVS
jgi:arginine/ornithine N-succinyltransferase beta subunit